MAERRMFAKSVVMDDKFLDLTPVARCLYFALNMVADDDGFVGAPKRVIRNCGASQKALRILVDAGYVVQFDSGVVGISHWCINNQIRKDRHRPTAYFREARLMLEQIQREGK